MVYSYYCFAVYRIKMTNKYRLYQATCNLYFFALWDYFIMHLQRKLSPGQNYICSLKSQICLSESSKSSRKIFPYLETRWTCCVLWLGLPASVSQSAPPSDNIRADWWRCAHQREVFCARSQGGMNPYSFTGDHLYRLRISCFVF